jgi:DNA primase
VLVTEGYMDVVALAQLGFANAVATLGTACTPDHVQKLFRFTDAVVFSFDGDAAGRRAARKALDGALPYATDTRSIKFLFLPAEHDPDSYVREFGQEAFAEQIRQATPLSRFLIEAASVDCDLSSAEGRARLSSQARPLWQLLPEGAFKQQLLAELAQLIGLDAVQLDRLWAQQAAGEHRHAPSGVAPAATAPVTAPGEYTATAGAPAQRQWERPFQKAGGKTGRWSDRWKKDTAPAYPAGPRTLPASRADHAARLLLANMALWENLAGEDQAMLCALPAPHGPLFVWMESQFHEHGPLGWSALQAEMQGQPFAEEAARWMQQQALHASAEAAAPDVLESRDELRRLLNLMLIDRLKELETEALAQAQSGEDPDALQRYKSLYERRRELIAAQ